MNIMKKEGNVFTNIIKENYTFLLLLIGLVVVISIQGCQPSSPTLSVGNCCKIKNPALVTQACIATSLNTAECAAIAAQTGSSYELAPASSCFNIERNPDCGTGVTIPAVLYIPFEDLSESTTVTDSSGNNYIGTKNGGPTQVIGKIDKALKFDGVNDYVDFGDVLDMERTDHRTFAFWVKMPSGAGSRFIIAKQNNNNPADSNNGIGYNIVTSSSGSLIFSLINNQAGVSNWLGVTGTTNIQDNNWHYVAVTYDGSSSASGVKIYIDGVSDTLTINSNTLTATTLSAEPLRIGCRAGCSFSRFNGAIDEVYIYNKVLTDTEILSYLTNFMDTNKIGCYLHDGPINRFIPQANPPESPQPESLFCGTGIDSNNLYACSQGYAQPVEDCAASGKVCQKGVGCFKNETTACPYPGAGYSDNFDNLDLTKWYVAGDYVSLDNGRIKYNLPASSQVYNAIHSKNKFYFDGDFDMMISYDVSNSSSGYRSEIRGWRVGLEVLTNPARTGSDKRASIQRVFNDSNVHKYEAGYTLNNVWTEDTATNDKISDIMGRLRLRREGGNIYAYYLGWENSRWEYAGNPNGYLITSGFTEPVYVRISSENSGGFPNFTSFIGNFMVGCLPGTAKLIDPVNIGDTSIHVEGGEIYKWAVGDTIYLGSSKQGYNITNLEYTHSVIAGLSDPTGTYSSGDPVTEDESAYCSGGGKDYCADTDWNSILTGDVANGQCFPITKKIVHCAIDDDETITVQKNLCQDTESCMPDFGCVPISNQCSDGEGTYADSGHYSSLCITDGKKGWNGHKSFIFGQNGANCISYRCLTQCGIGGSTAYWYKSGEAALPEDGTSVGCTGDAGNEIQGYCQIRG